MIIDSSMGTPNINVLPGGNSYGGGDAFGNNGAWWIIILFLFAMMGGWGNNGNANASTAYVPYYGGVQQGFDQASIMSGIGAIQANQNAYQMANINSMNGIAASLQNCCCENRAATADLKYTVATEACADRSAVTAALQEVTTQNNINTQKILDTMCQDKIDAKNEQIAELRQQLTMAQLAASQNAQTAAILTDNLAQTQALEQYLAPTARPAYIVQNPNCCSSSMYTACGCSR